MHIARVAEIMADEPVHRRGGEDERVLHPRHRWGLHRHIGRRINQHLEANFRQIFIPRHDRHDGGEIAAGAVAADRDLAAIHAQAVGLVKYPSWGGCAVGHRSGEFMFRRHAVIHRDHAALAFIGDLPTQLVVTFKIANHPATTMIKDQGWQFRAGARALAAIQPQRNVAERAGAGQVAKLGDLGRVWLSDRAAGGEYFACVCHRHFNERRSA